jgi:diaminohydroxyphosphoribosylaminopyrimidine deaminase/5-amino-6-(5-phosphoribosylamino)uracil reductase
LEHVQDDLLIVTRGENARRRAALEARGARVLTVDTQQEGGISLRALLQHLGQGDITSVMIEGGGLLNRSALVAGIVDKLYLFQAPRFLGPEAIPMINGASTNSLPRLLRYKVERIDEDLLLTGYLRDPWAAFSS